MKWVLLPGFDGTGRLFDPFLKELPPEIEPIVISYPPDCLSDAAKLLEIVLQSLPLDEPYALIAESFSGPIALRASVRHARPPAAVVLCASFGASPVPKILAPILQALGNILVHVKPPKFLVRQALAGPGSDELLELSLEALAAVKPEVLADRLRVLLGFSVRDLPERLNAPLLYLRATRDRLIGPGSLHLLQKLYPEVTVVAMDAPHLLLQVRPREAARAISEFIQDQTAAP